MITESVKTMKNYFLILKLKLFLLSARYEHVGK